MKDSAFVSAPTHQIVHMYVWIDYSYRTSEHTFPISLRSVGKGGRKLRGRQHSKEGGAVLWACGGVRHNAVV